MNAKEAFEKLFGRPPQKGDMSDPYFLSEIRREVKDVVLQGVQLSNSETLAYFPRIAAEKDNGKTTFLGGDQAWFARKTQRYSGCGPVSAANILASMAAKDVQVAEKLGIAPLPDGRFGEKEFQIFMESVYRTVGTLEVPVWRTVIEKSKRNTPKWPPPSFGREVAGFEAGLLRYATQHGIHLKSHRFLASYAGYSQGLQFIWEALKQGSPVALLTSWNRHPLQVYWNGYEKPPAMLKNGMRSHFVTIVGVRRNPIGHQVELIVSSWGRVCSIEYTKLHESWQSPLAVGAALLYFTQCGSGKPGYLQNIAAYAGIPGSLLKTIVGMVASPFVKRSKK